MNKFKDIILTHLPTLGRVAIILGMLLFSLMSFGTPDAILETIPPSEVSVSIEMQQAIDESKMPPVVNTFKELKEYDESMNTTDSLARNKVNDRKISYLRVYILGKVTGAILIIAALYTALRFWVKRESDTLYLINSLINVGLGFFTLTGGELFGGVTPLCIAGGIIISIGVANLIIEVRSTQKQPQPSIDEQLDSLL